MANAILNVGQTGGQINISTAAAPATPAVGVVTLYAGTDKALHALNSDGTDITIAAAGAASPITVQQTNSLVSTVVGATAGAGSNCAVVIGNNACTTAGVGSESVVIGSAAKHYVYGSNSIIIGPGSAATNLGIVSIGYLASGDAQNGVNIGTLSCTVCNGGVGSIAIGCRAFAYGLVNQPDIAIGACTVSRFGGMAIGSLETFSCETKGIAIGLTSKVFPGATGTIVLGNSSVGGTGACNSIVLGNSACSVSTNTIAIGNTAKTICQDNIAIGNTSCSCICEGIVIGKNAFAPKPVNGDIGSAIVIGQDACVKTGGSYGGAVVIGKSACGFSYNSVNIGPGTQSGGESAIAIGTIPNASADFSIAIGRQSSASAADSIAMGRTALACSEGTIAIGKCSRVCANPYEHGAIAIGTCAQHNGIYGVVLGFRSCTTGGNQNTVIGDTSCAGNTSQAFGSSVRATGSTAIAIGYDTTASGNGSIAIGGGMCSTAACAVAIGLGAISSHACAVALGANITTEKTNTTHVNSLIAYGQAASKAHAVGSTGGTVAIDWDNSNVQTLTLTSSATVSMSNPIDGGVYTLQITQGGTGSYTATWSNIKWPGGTPPTLSTAAGALDVLTFIYGPTAYVGNANLNFS